MRRLYGLLTILVLGLGLAIPADAGNGHRMAEGKMTPQLLAERIEASLQRDPSGDTVVAGTACSTPRHFLEAIEEMHDGLRFGRDWGAFTSYLRSLRRVENVAAKLPGTYRMSRTLGLAGGPCSLDLAGYTRQFRSGEHGWRDAEGRLVFAGDCINVTPARLESPRAAAPPPTESVCPPGYVEVGLKAYRRPRVFTPAQYPALSVETHHPYMECDKCTKWANDEFPRSWNDRPPSGDPVYDIYGRVVAVAVPKGTKSVCVREVSRGVLAAGCSMNNNNKGTDELRPLAASGSVPMN